MIKKITAVTGEYVAQDGTQKAEFNDLGVIIAGKNGKEYLMLKPEINLAGVLIKQNALAIKRGEQPRDMVMTSILDQQAQQATQHGYQQPQGQPQQRPAQYATQPSPSAQNPHNYAQNQQSQYAQGRIPPDDFADDINF